jgi:homoserine/homoserine lactone efflux protein
VRQVVILGGAAMAIAAVSDGSYAVLTGQARRLLSRPRIKILSWLSGALLIGGGAWLALTRPR